MKGQVVLATVVCFFVGGALMMGCGDDDDGGEGAIPTCSDTFTPCGGDPTGEWALSGTCDPLAPYLSMCPEMVVTVTQDRSTGTDTFEANGNYALHVSYDVDFNATAPLSCMLTGSCDFLTSVGDTFQSCEQVGEDCECVGHYVDTIDEVGTWRMEGNNLMTTVSGATSEDTTEICVTGDIGESLSSDGTRFIWTK